MWSNLLTTKRGGAQWQNNRIPWLLNALIPFYLFTFKLSCFTPVANATLTILWHDPVHVSKIRQQNECHQTNNTRTLDFFHLNDQTLEWFSDSSHLPDPGDHTKLSTKPFNHNSNSATVLRPAPRNYHAHLGQEIAKNWISPNMARILPLGN